MPFLHVKSVNVRKEICFLKEIFKNRQGVYNIQCIVHRIYTVYTLYIIICVFSNISLNDTNNFEENPFCTNPTNSSTEHVSNYNIAGN